MLRFFGFDFELRIDDVLDRHSESVLCSASDASGGRWLVLEVGPHDDHPAWLCAPITPPALYAVRTGQSAVRDAFRHSATGTVELVSVEDGHAVPDRCLLGRDIPEELLPDRDWRLDPGVSGLASDGPVERRTRPRRCLGIHW